MAQGYGKSKLKLFAFGHLHCHPSPWNDAPPWALELREMVRRVLEEKDSNMVDYTKIQADIAAQTTVLQGVVTAVQALNGTNADLTKQVADLKAALAANDTTAIQAALDSMDATIAGNTSLVAGLVPAVTANTPTPPADATAAATAAATTTPTDPAAAPAAPATPSA